MRAGWEIKKLGEVCIFQRGLTYTKSDEVEFSENCVLRSNNIDLDSMSIVLDDLKYVRKDLIIDEDKIVKPNTILICMSNGSKQHIGKVAFVDRKYGYAFGGFMGLIIPQSIFPKYVYYSCLSPSYKHFLKGIGNGANITNLKFSDLSNYTIPVPPLSEQERIVAELDLLNEVIAKKREQLTQLDALAQSIFYDMFGDPITNEKGWEICLLKNVAKIVGGSTPKTNIEEYWNGNKYWVTPAELHGTRYISATERCITDKAVKETHLTLLPPGTVLLSSRAPIGKVCITRVPMYCNQGFKNIICSERLHNEYVYQYFLDKAESLNSLGSGATFKEISKAVTEKIPIPVPPLSLQRRFAEKIEAIEQQKERICQSLAEVQRLFDSRMDYYFNN